MKKVTGSLAYGAICRKNVATTAALKNQSYQVKKEAGNLSSFLRLGTSVFYKTHAKKDEIRIR